MQPRCPTDRPWSIYEHGPNSHEICLDLRGSDVERRVLLVSDPHIDSKKCQRDLLRHHLGEAVELDAPVCFNGDTADAMQGKYDPRSRLQEVHPRIFDIIQESGMEGETSQHGSRAQEEADYYDAVGMMVTEELAPFAKQIAVMGYGNHETAVLKKANTNILRDVSRDLRKDHGSPVRLGGYCGYIKFTCWTSKTQRHVLDMFYFHGANGGVATFGVLAVNRQQASFDADIYWTGHSHDTFSVPRSRVFRDRANAIRARPTLHVRTGGYKDDFGTGKMGWSVERGHPPKPTGSYWLCFKQNPVPKSRPWPIHVASLFA